MSVEPIGMDRRFLLRGVSWATYEALLADLGGRPIRLSYDAGELELMSPSGEHDRLKHRFGRLVTALTEELDIPVDGCGSATLRRGDVNKGLEPDEGFYIRNEPRVRGKIAIDLDVDPPPDLVIEIEIASSSVDREGIYAALGVPELWRHDGESLRVFRLRPDGVAYEPAEVSPSFPFLPLREFEGFIRPRPGEDQTSWSKRFRAWVRDRVLPLYRAQGPGAGEV